MVRPTDQEKTTIEKRFYCSQFPKREGTLFTPHRATHGITRVGQEAEEMRRKHGGRVVIVVSIGKARRASILGVASLNYFNRL